MTVGENVALPMQMFTRLNAAAIRRWCGSSSAWSAWSTRSTSCLPNSAAACANGPAWRGRLRSTPTCCSSTSRPPGLDPITSSRLDDLILNLRDGLGATIVIVSHELPSLFAIADDGVFLDAETKTAIAHGSPSALRDSCTDPQVEAFMRRERPEALPPERRRHAIHDGSQTGQTVGGGLRAGRHRAGPGAIVLFGKFSLFNPTVRAAVVFEGSIAGLSVGAPVTFRGVRVGAVESIAIQFDPKTHTAYIPVIVRIEPDRAQVDDATGGRMRRPLGPGDTRLRAELNTQSFVTGQSQIDLDFDPASPAVLHPDITNLPEIPTRQSTIQRANEQLSQLPLRELADDTNATLKSLRGLSEKLDQDLPPLVESLKTTSDHSGQMVETATRRSRICKTSLIPR